MVDCKYCGRTCTAWNMKKHEESCNLNPENGFTGKCENCAGKNSGHYGSGRFCSSACARHFSTKNKRKIINKKVSSTLSGRLTGNKVERIVKTCPTCKHKFEDRITSKTKWCSQQCWRDFKRANRNPRQQYAADCKFKFNVYQFPGYFNLELINKNGWYSASNRNNNLNGVSRDHRISVAFGFKHNIDPAIISHPANCKLLLHTDNQRKNTSSSITLDELLKEIQEFDLLYKGDVPKLDKGADCKSAI